MGQKESNGVSCLKGERIVATYKRECASMNRGRTSELRATERERVNLSLNRDQEEDLDGGGAASRWPGTLTAAASSSSLSTAGS